MACGTGAFGSGRVVVCDGLDWIATVPPAVLLTANVFGRVHAGRVFAWTFVAHQ